MRSIAYFGLGTRFTACCVVVTAGCGLSDGEKGSLRRLFDDELPGLSVPTRDEQEHDAGGRDDDTRTTSGRTTTGRDSSADDETNVSPVAPTGVNPTGVAPTEDPTGVSPTTDDTEVDPTQPCEDDTTSLTLGDECTVGVGACEMLGQVVCGLDGLTCSARAGSPGNETCNGIDDDCDGEIDEGTFGYCTVGEGGCEREGLRECVDMELVCNAEVVTPQTEICNGLDDDCDEFVDEDFDVGSACIVGLGECQRSGWTVCVDEDVACDAQPGTPEEEVCNTYDDDCDGETDEGFDVGAECSVGLGACQVSSTIQCFNGGARCNAYAEEPTLELCNEIDDDCDGEVDNKHACPGDVVQNTKPFTDALWYTASTGTCGRERVLQFWPEINEETYYSEFPCYSSWWTFRPTDWALFVYDSEGDGAFVRHHEGEDDEILDTPDCRPLGPFFFDADDRIYYRCYSVTQENALRRGVGASELLAPDVDALYAVTADGRALVSLNAQMTLLDDEGQVIETYDPAADFVGSMTLQEQRVTVSGNDLFLLYTRQLPNQEWEFVMFRIDVDNELSLVRRLHLGEKQPSINLISLSDGSIFEEEPDPDGASTDLVRRYAPDGTESIVWRESETTFTTHISDQLLIGPRL